MGMTYDQFWNQDVDLVKPYRKAWKIKQDVENQKLWLQGAYVYEAILCASPVLHDFAKKGTKPTPYPEKPYELTSMANKEKKEAQREKEKKSDAKAKAILEMWMVNVNKKFEQNGGGDNG